MQICTKFMRMIDYLTDCVAIPDYHFVEAYGQYNLYTQS